MKGQTDKASQFCLSVPRFEVAYLSNIQLWALSVSWPAHMAFSCVSKEEDLLGRVKEVFSHHRAVFTYSALEIWSSKGANVSSDEWHLRNGGDMHRSGVLTRQPP